MKCHGCDGAITAPAAYAVMNESDLAGAAPDVKGPGRFHGMAVCGPCFEDPAHRKRKLKAHFLLPEQVGKLGSAGSSTGVQA